VLDRRLEILVDPETTRADGARVSTPEVTAPEVVSVGGRTYPVLPLGALLRVHEAMGKHERAALCRARRRSPTRAAT
jgi:hypothetical protein